MSLKRKQNELDQLSKNGNMEISDVNETKDEQIAQGTTTVRSFKRVPKVPAKYSDATYQNLLAHIGRRREAKKTESSDDLVPKEDLGTVNHNELSEIQCKKKPNEKATAAKRLKIFKGKHKEGAKNQKESIYKCKHCPNSYSSSARLDLHMLIHDGIKLFCCKLCPFKVTEEETMQKHVAKHSVKKEKKRSYYLLLIPVTTELTTASVTSLSNGTSMNEEDLADPGCEMASPTKSTVENTKNPVASADTSDCANDDVSINSEEDIDNSDLNEDAETSSHDDDFDDASLKLNSLKYKKTLLGSLSEEKKGNSRKRTVYVENSKTESSVPKAEMSSKPEDTGNGQKKVENPKRFPCGHCSLVSTSRRGLVAHTAKIHSFRLKFPYKCTYCPQFMSEFTEKAPYEEHLKIHMSEKPYSCSICTYRTATESELSEHTAKHVVKNFFTCPQCYRQYGSEALLAYHLKGHSGVREKYACKICSFKGVRASSYVQHMKDHETKKPVSCPDCSYTCLFQSKLKRHRRLHVEKFGTYACAFCDLVTKYELELRRHTMKIHLGQKLYSCELCPAMFAKSYTLKCHMKTHSQETSISVDANN